MSSKPAARNVGTAVARSAVDPHVKTITTVVRLHSRQVLCLKPPHARSFRRIAKLQPCHTSMTSYLGCHRTDQQPNHTNEQQQRDAARRCLLSKSMDLSLLIFASASVLVLLSHYPILSGCSPENHISNSSKSCCTSGGNSGWPSLRDRGPNAKSQPSSKSGSTTASATVS